MSKHRHSWMKYAFDSKNKNRLFKQEPPVVEAVKKKPRNLAEKFTAWKTR